MVIFLDSREYFDRFNIRVSAQGLSAETAANFQGWAIADEALSPSATEKVLVPYLNRFGGTVTLPGGIWGNNGNVGIGTTSPGGYKLAVEGTLGARKVKVTQAAWADYVFHPDYRLPPLQEVEQYVQRHRHLPDIPPASQVEKEGLDLAEINKRMMQKIEELTLYIIEQEKRLRKVEEQNRMLLKKVEEVYGDRLGQNCGSNNKN